MHFPVSKNSDKIERGPATEAGTTTKGRQSFPITKYVEEIVLQTQNGIIFACFNVCFQKRDVVLPRRKFKACPLTHLRQTIEVKDIRLSTQQFGEGKNLVDILFCQGKHHHRIDPEFAKYFEKAHGSFEVTIPPDEIIVCR